MAEKTKKPQADKPKNKDAGTDDAQAVLERMKKKEAENPDDCVFC